MILNAYVTLGHVVSGKKIFKISSHKSILASVT